MLGKWLQIAIEVLKWIISCSVSERSNAKTAAIFTEELVYFSVSQTPTAVASQNKARFMMCCQNWSANHRHSWSFSEKQFGVFLHVLHVRCRWPRSKWRILLAPWKCWKDALCSFLFVGSGGPGVRGFRADSLNSDAVSRGELISGHAHRPGVMSWDSICFLGWCFCWLCVLFVVRVCISECW